MGGLQSRIAALAPAILGILFGPYARGQTALNQPVQVPPPPFWVALANALA